MRKGISLGGFALVLVGLMLTLTTMAYASPPDPSWVRGLYDDGDFDNVVGFITSAAGLVEAIIARSPTCPSSGCPESSTSRKCHCSRSAFGASSARSSDRLVQLRPLRRVQRHEKP